MSFARHQTFYLRSGWLSKAIYHLNYDSKLFSKKDATSTLGIGKNMVQALRFWVEACGLAEKRKKEYLLTPFGELVLKNDPYFEEDITWWLIHKNLVSDVEGATSWYYLFNKYPSNDFTEEKFLNLLNRFCKEDLNVKVSPNSLKKDFQCIVATYVKNVTNGTPEDNMICPLSNLGLVSKENYGYKKQPAIKLPLVVAYFTISENARDGKYLNIKDTIEPEKSLAKVFNLSDENVYEILASLEDRGFLTYSRTGGLDSITLLLDAKVELKKQYESFNRVGEIK